MRLFKLELRRILKSRLNCALLIAAIALSALLAFIPTRFVYSSDTDEQGNTVEWTGIRAIRHEKAAQAEAAGTVTAEKVRRALEKYQACLRRYGVEGSYDLPEGVYAREILPCAPLLHGVKEVFADPETGVAPSLMEIDPARLDDFYGACDARIQTLMQAEQGRSPAAQRRAVAMYRSVQKPFVFYPGDSSNALDYQTLLSFLLLLFCAIIASPVFSADSQSGAGDVFRCTRQGRERLGVVRVAATLSICCAVCALCSAIYIVLSNSLFGWDCTRTSMQMTYSIFSLARLNVGQLQGAIALGSLLSVLAMSGLSLFISTRAKNTATAMAVSLLFCLLPMVISIIDLGQAGAWLQCLLPAGGASLQSGFLYAIREFNFLSAGGLAVWTPHAMLLAACAEILLFGGLAVRAHARRCN